MSWTTANEFEFIAGLGMFREIGSGADRADLLRGYIRGAELRTVWPGLDRKRVLDFARQELALCEGQVAPAVGAGVLDGQNL